MKTSNPKLPIRNLTENLLLMAFMMIMLMVLLAEKSMAQEQPVSDDQTLFSGEEMYRYRLNKVVVMLKGGDAFRAVWIGVSRDSLLFEIKRPVPGCVISISNKETWIKGKVLSVSDSAIVIRNAKYPRQEFPMKWVKEIRVKKYPAGANQILDIRYVGMSTVEKVLVHKPKAGLKAFFLGGALGETLGYSIGYTIAKDNHFEHSFEALGVAKYGFVLGGLTGLVIANSSRDFEISGSHLKAQSLVNKMQK